MVESVKSLTKNIDVSKNSSSNTNKVDKLDASSISQSLLLIQSILVAHCQLQH